jgi:hypothetical protein
MASSSDARCGSSLLSAMDPDAFLEYHSSVVNSIVSGGDSMLHVVPDVGEGKGKGVIAQAAIESGRRMFTEAPLVRIAAVHTHKHEHSNGSISHLV